MSYIILFISVHVLANFLSLSKNAAELSGILHNSCVQFIGNENNWGSLPAAFLCGREIESLTIRSLMIQTGLFHVLVVSGSHLSTLRGLSKLFRILIPLGLLYVLICKMDPPIVRAYCFLFVTAVSVFFKLHWRPSKIFFISLLLAFFWIPQWHDSTSLRLSLAATLALALCEKTPWTQGSRFRSGLLTFVLLFPFLCGWSQNNPLMAVPQILLMSPLNLLLWGIGLFSMLSPPVASFLYWVFLQMFSGVQKWIGPWQAPFESPLLLKWALIGLYFFWLRNLENKKAVS